MTVRKFLIVVMVLAVSACATTRPAAPPSSGGMPASSPAAPSQPISAAEGGEDSEMLYGEEEPTEPLEADLRTGSGVFLNESAAARRPATPAMSEQGEVTFNWEGVPVQSVVHTVLGDLLQENFVIGPGVSGEITFSTARPVNRDQVLPILERLLAWNNIALVWSDNRYNVLPLGEAVAGNLSPQLGGLSSARGYEVQAVPLEYIAATEMEKLLEPYAREGAILRADNARSLIFLAGTRAELASYLRTVEIFDVDWLDGMSVGVFPLTRVETETVVEELNALFNEEGQSPMAGMLRFVPMERLNSVMVITPQAEYLNQVGDWIRRLDQTSSEAGSRLYVYQVQNLEAAVVADYLNSIFSTRSSGTQRRGGEVAPGLQPVTVDSFNRDSIQNSTAGAPPQRRGNAGDNEGGISLGDGEEVSVTAVEETNALLIQASPSQYDTILAAIKRLDTEPLQVHIEAQVLEVTLNEQLEYGVNWFLSNEVPSESNGLLGAAEGFPLNESGNFAQFGGSPNFFTALTRGPGHSNFIAATISALDSITDVRVLSTPSLLVRNNEEAQINVGESLSVQTTAINPNTGSNNTIASNQYIRTGVQLNVTPRVNPGGLVYVDVSQNVSSPSGTTGTSGNPNINERSLNTKVAVQSGNTVILGGLIRELVNEGESGLPGVRRIPFLGKLFGTTTRSDQRTELLVLITPTVVQTVDELNQVSSEYQRKFQNVRPIRQGERVELTTGQR